MKIKLNYQGLETLFAELAPAEKKAIHLLVTGSDKENKITKLTTELVSIIAFLCKKLNWIEDPVDCDGNKDENLIDKVDKKESKEGILTEKTVSDGTGDYQKENNASTAPDTANHSDTFEDL